MSFQQQISGRYKNELGSEMEIKVINNEINGFYISKVGNATDRYLLVGRINFENEISSTLFTFSVSWNNQYGNSNSVTSWSGQYYKDENKLYTTWILTRRCLLKDRWSSQNVGSNIFIKI